MFLDLYSKLGTQPWKVRGLEPSRPCDPYYLLMVMRHLDGVPYERYRQTRRHFLEAYLQVLKVIYPDAKDIIGIATGLPGNENSEDLLYLDARYWTAEAQSEAEELQRDTGFLTVVNRFDGRVKTFPDPMPSNAPQPVRGKKGRHRNKLCYCGSGMKFKRCHG